MLEISFAFFFPYTRIHIWKKKLKKEKKKEKKWKKMKKKRKLQNGKNV